MLCVCVRVCSTSHNFSHNFLSFDSRFWPFWSDIFVCGIWYSRKFSYFLLVVACSLSVFTCVCVWRLPLLYVFLIWFLRLAISSFISYSNIFYHRNNFSSSSFSPVPLHLELSSIFPVLLLFCLHFLLIDQMDNFSWRNVLWIYKSSKYFLWYRKTENYAGIERIRMSDFMPTKFAHNQVLQNYLSIRFNGKTIKFKYKIFLNFRIFQNTQIYQQFQIELLESLQFTMNYEMNINWPERKISQFQGTNCIRSIQIKICTEYEA